jgi:hypothetical protein
MVFHVEKQSFLYLHCRAAKKTSGYGEKWIRKAGAKQYVMFDLTATVPTVLFMAQDSPLFCLMVPTAIILLQSC